MLQSEELHDFHSLPSIVRMLNEERRKQACTSAAGTGNAYRIWWKCLRTQLLGRLRRK
jgi:hypothetical protein